jgi:adenylate cyclase
LGVRNVLEGSVRKAGARVRITAQLIDVESGGHVWAERFDRDVKDIFAVQDEVTRNIVNALKVRLAGSLLAHLGHRGKVNAAAYDYAMRARSSFLQFTLEGINEARALLNRALELDPNFATGYAQLAQLDAAEYVNGWAQGSLDHLERGMKFARKALELDPEEERAHQAIAILALWRKDYGSAEQAARRSLELAPNYSGGLMALGQVLDFSGRHAEAIEVFEQALRIDPGYDIILHFLGRAQVGAGLYVDAESSFRRRLVRNPRSDMTRAYLASLLGAAGRVAVARRLWAEILEINPNFSIEHLRRVLPYKDPAWFERFVDGLRKAGIAQGKT